MFPERKTKNCNCHYCTKMSLCVNVLKSFRKVSALKINILSNKSCILSAQKIKLNPERLHGTNSAAGLLIMKKRRKIAGPEKLRKRSERFEWNYDAELYAFNKRLRENITEDTLRCLFVHDSFVSMEKKKRITMAQEDLLLDMKSNTALVSLGNDIMSKFLLRYLRVAYRYVPEEGIVAVRDFLISDYLLSYVSSNIGTKDLIFSAEYPPSESTFAETFRALIGGIASDDSVAAAENFVLDFVCPQLIDKDVFEIWEFENPLAILNSILQKKGDSDAESRLIFESGRNTLEAVYHVGLYSNKAFLGRGVGETLSFAEEMAAYDALRRLFHLNDSNIILPLGETARKMDFNSEMKNVSLSEMCGKSLDLIKS